LIEWLGGGCDYHQVYDQPTTDGTKDLHRHDGPSLFLLSPKYRTESSLTARRGNQKPATLVTTPVRRVVLRRGEFLMFDSQKYAQGVHWNLYLDVILAIALAAPLVALVLLLI
jgi:hypothetical protein